MVCMYFKTHFVIFVPYYKYELLEKNNPSYYFLIYYKWKSFYIDILFITIVSWQFHINFIICKKIVIYYLFFFKKHCEEKYIISWNVQRYFNILDMRNSIFINYFTNAC
jgi:hypothetical protein